MLAADIAGDNVKRGRISLTARSNRLKFVHPPVVHILDHRNFRFERHVRMFPPSSHPDQHLGVILYLVMRALLGLLKFLFKVDILDIHAYRDATFDLSLEPREEQITMLEVVFNAGDA